MFTLHTVWTVKRSKPKVGFRVRVRGCTGENMRQTMHIVKLITLIRSALIPLHSQFSRGTPHNDQR